MDGIPQETCFVQCQIRPTFVDFEHCFSYVRDLGACKDIAASAALTAVIAEDGTLYTFGENSHEQCGVGETDSLIWPPTPVRNLHGVSASSVALGKSSLRKFPQLHVSSSLSWFLN